MKLSRLPILVSALVFSVSSAISFAAENAATKGKAKAEAQCNVCHGSNGMSQIPNAPHLAGQPEIYLVEQLKNYRSGKRANEVMAVLAKPLSDDDIANLAAWYASIEIKATPKS
jgi:cytochrome c553